MFDFLKTTITVLGTEVNVAAQIADLFAFAFLGIAYLCKDKEKYLIFASCAALVFCLESTILAAYTNVICNAFTMIRNVILMLLMRTGKRPKRTLSILFGTAFSAVGVYSIATGNYIGVLPPLFGLTLTVLTTQNHLGILKVGCTFVEIGFLFFNYLIGAYVGVLRQLVIITSCVIGSVAYYRGLNSNKESDTNENRFSKTE